MKKNVIKLNNIFDKIELNSNYSDKMLGSFIFRIFGVILSFSLNIVLVRMMGLEEYGRYCYYISIINFISIFAIFGFDNANIKYLSKYFANEQYDFFLKFYLKSERFVLKTSFLLVSLVIALNYLFWDDFQNKIYFIFIGSFLIPLKSLTNIYFSVLRAMERLYLYLSINLVLRPLCIIFLLFVIDQFPYYKINLENYFLIILSIHLVITIFSKSYINRTLPQKNYSEKINIESSWLLVPFYIVIIQYVNLFNLSINNIMINYYDGSRAVSLYSVALNVSQIVGFSLSSINIFLAPKISNIYNSGKIKDLQGILKFIAKTNLIFGSISTIIIIIFGKIFLQLYSAEMIESYQLILILIIGQLFHVFCGSVTLLMIMTKLEKIAAISIALSAILNVILNLIFMPKYGLIGCCIATTISTVVYNFICSIIIFRKLNLNPTILIIRN